MVRMRIACPTCSTAYDVPERLLADSARRLRCSRCGAEFELPAAPAPAAASAPPAVAPEPAPPPPPMPPPDPLPMIEAWERLSIEVEEAAASRALVRAWVASIAIVVGGAVALVLMRERVMEAWPPAARLFSAIGLA